MSASLTVGILLILSVIGYWMGRSRAVAVAGGRIASLHSVPNYYGLYIAIWAGLPALLLLLFWVAVKFPLIESIVLDSLSHEMIEAWARVMVSPSDLEALLQRLPNLEEAALTTTQEQLLLINIGNIAAGQAQYVNPAVVDVLRPAAEHYNQLLSLSNWAVFAACMALAAAGLFLGRQRISPEFRARNNVERVINWLLIVCSLIAILTTVGIVLSLLFESARFFAQVSPVEFLFGLHWSPQTAIRADQAGASGAFGAIPLFTGTLLIATIAMTVALPVGLMSAIYLSEYAPRPVRSTIKPVLEILAGIPTVVYGFFAILTVAPVIRDLGAAIGLDVSSNSALAAGVVMGIMIVPFVSSLSDDVINAVPQSLRDGSYGLGATRSETIRQVILPAALPGIVGAFLLAVSRAIGETMIVVMAAGLQANLTFNPLDAVTTVTVQIASLLVGDQEFDSPKTLSVFALGLVLFAVTLLLNVVALRIVQKYREKYD
ncbi:phosphate ABC transporter permease subunit PstC [Indioceanicola profundi]|uniref:phosphate ABC transporter permease subunit PstC n=1 Tax=Indioceanicola profundi TaxID=2220096 RepID=UPI000E6AC892|nr:phosphate ABC transporter permease subunit PstC [Indioceanicola profundi]